MVIIVSIAIRQEIVMIIVCVTVLGIVILIVIVNSSSNSPAIELCGLSTDNGIYRYIIQYNMI